MTWSEFCIRMNGYNQKEEVEWLKVREVAYSSQFPVVFSSKKPPSKQRWMPIGKQSTPKVSKDAFEMLAKAQREYKEKIK